LTEQLSSQKVLVTALTKANNFVGGRFHRLERAMEIGQLPQDNIDNALAKHNAGSYVAIAALKVDCNSTDGQLKRIMTDQTETIAAQRETIAFQSNTIAAPMEIVDIEVVPRDSP
jgi:hypothetical protein